jgi:ABC-type multidrug transport system fused ATPase/permease subunit
MTAETSTSDYAVLRRLVVPFVRETKASVVWLVAGILAVTATALSHVSTAWMVGKFIDATPHGDRRSMAIAVAGLFGAAVLASTGGAVRALAGRKITDAYRAYLRSRLMGHVLRLPLSSVEGRDSRHMNSLFIDDVNALANLVNPLALNVSMAVIQLVVTIAILLARFDAFIWLVLLIVPLNACVGLWQMPRLKSSGREELAQKARMDGFALEMLEGIRELKGLAIGPTVMARMDEITRQGIATRWRAALLGTINDVRYSATWLLLSIVYFIGGLAVARGELTIGSLTAFIFYLGYLETPISRLWHASSEWQRLRASLSRYANTLGLPAEAEGPLTLQRSASPDIEFRDVTFRYPGGQRPAIDGVNLYFRAGQRVAVVGASGAGKTTLLSLLVRLFDPDEGTVLIGGTDIRRYTLASLRQYVGVISQDPFIFDGTVSDNIGMGLAHSAAEIEAAARIADADTFIRDMPAGYQSMLGTRGTRLSGGQKRRLAIARAIIRRPRILILDEITGALDSVSDAAIQRALEEVADECTTLTISHRLSSTASAESIVVVDAGRVAGIGPHRTLLRECPIYRTLAELQDLEQVLTRSEETGLAPALPADAQEPTMAVAS